MTTTSSSTKINMDKPEPHKRHWSFVVTDKKYIYPLILLLSFAGIAAAIILKNPTYFSRTGNFIIAIGVWISMRYTLREGINKYKDLARSTPVFHGGKLNSDFFNDIAFSIGDAKLQIHGLCIVIYGSAVGSLGDLLLEALT